jgi:multiple sugar transport system substrate-binding protein
MFMKRCLLSILLVLALVSAFSIPMWAAEPVTISILMGPDNTGGWHQVISDFEKANPDIKVNLIEGPSATNTREDMYATSFMAKESTYDLVYMDIIWVPKFAAAGWLLPLDKWFPKTQWKLFLPGDINGSIYNGHIYRSPVQSDAGMLYYRKDLLAQAGMTPPRTFGELVQISQKLQKPPGLWGFVWQGKQYEGLVCDFLEYVWGSGGDVINKSNEVVLDQAPAVEALQYMVDLINKYKVSPADVLTFQEEESRRVFQDGHAVFHRNWPYVWTLANMPDSPVKDKIGIIPMVHKPGYKSAATQGGWGIGISAFSKHPNEAWKFASYVSSYETQKKLHFLNGIIPTRQALFSDPDILKESPHYPDLYKVQLGARPRPVTPRYGEISDVIQREVSAALIQKISAQDALKNAAQAIRDILKR